MLLAYQWIAKSFCSYFYRNATILGCHIEIPNHDIQNQEEIGELKRMSE
jgi:hypothetical protein